MLLKVCYLPFAVLLLKFHFINTARAVVGDYVNVCENVEDHIFLQDIEDCAKYIVCVNGQPKSQQCQAGLYFHVQRQACTALKQSCFHCPTGRMINIPLLKTCDKYISCYYGQSLLKKCGPNQQFNVQTRKCDFSRNVDCVENRCSIYATDKKPIYVPSAANCSNYYVCQSGQTKMKTCDEGFYFSDECNCCDKSENVQCLIEDVKTAAKSSKQKRLSITLPKLKHQATLVRDTNQVKCPPIGHFLYQYIEDAGYYFACVEGKATFYACPSDSQFDDKLKRCVSKEKETIELIKDQTNDEQDIECPLSGSTTLAHALKTQYYLCIEGNSVVLTCAAGLFYDANVKSCTQYGNTGSYIDVDAFSPKCPKFGTFKYAHEDKTKFNLCLDGSTFILNCPANEVFDPNFNTCRLNYEMDNDSSNISNEHQYAEVATNFICPRLGTFIYPHLQKNHYYVCIDGNAISFACAQGQIFDTKTNTCKNEENLIDDANNQTPRVLDETVDILCPPVGAIKFAHKQKEKFYLCVNGMGSVLACAEGSFFEPQAGICRRTFESITAVINSIEDNETENDVPSEHCPIAGTFIYPHNEENKYSICLDGKSLVFNCPQGLIFDNHKKICSDAIQMDNIVNQTSNTSSQHEAENIQHATNAQND